MLKRTGKLMKALKARRKKLSRWYSNRDQAQQLKFHRKHIGREMSRILKQGSK